MLVACPSGVLLFQHPVQKTPVFKPGKLVSVTEFFQFLIQRLQLTGALLHTILKGFCGLLLNFKRLFTTVLL